MSWLECEFTVSEAGPLVWNLMPVTSSHLLRSVDSFWLQVQRTHTEFGRRAFSVAAPTVWNALPKKLRQSALVVTLWTCYGAL